MKKITLILICIFTIFKAEGQDTFSRAFNDRLMKANMLFNRPDSFVAIPVISNKQVLYEYAVKHVNKNVEVRYIVNPLDTQLKSYNELVKNKKPGDVFIDPNTSYLAYFYSLLKNISSSPPANFTTINEEQTKNNFQADWAAFTFINLNKEFGQNYKYCLVVALHKNNFGDAYCIYLSDERNGLIHSAYANNLSSLKFK
ncbi:hypothetical protein SAMN05421821_103453 [Mucilaginibacter lappiensis]|uniref:Uncharacterized protein n=1 Tax=Mucilaginibacter lappiensis TaxID=354630 RepID=A0ABR6PLS7_9SPHI|nr:hypothetical protein [Mucilaginibacter lappiensis]MBB6109216.1 hypothetical protein [Mucilaginibacter lappiensis]SIQ80479.1 hypothetical protein SAMN05421821_103453 [Mucilaginibacter lappiensis]